MRATLPFIKGHGAGNDCVIVPDLEGTTAKKILAVFQGRASLVGKVPGASFDSASVDPDAVVIDITHDIPPQDIRSAAFALSAAWAYFPPATIFVVVDETDASKASQ